MIKFYIIYKITCISYYLYILVYLYSHYLQHQLKKADLYVCTFPLQIYTAFFYFIYTRNELSIVL